MRQVDREIEIDLEGEIKIERDREIVMKIYKYIKEEEERDKYERRDI